VWLEAAPTGQNHLPKLAGQKPRILYQGGIISMAKVQNTQSRTQTRKEKLKVKNPEITLAVNTTQSLAGLLECGKAFTGKDPAELAEAARKLAAKYDTIIILVNGAKVGTIRWSRTKIQGGFEARFAVNVRTKKVNLMESVCAIRAILRDYDCTSRDEHYDDKGQFVITTECGDKATAIQVYTKIVNFLLGMVEFDAMPIARTMTANA
jgi:NAD(P)-dependent dehydrogenase (short-subunit alcohol dehydrogenase family)